MSRYRPYPAYKDSGVEWLGEVPVDWSVAAVNHRYEVLLGKMLDEKRVTGLHLAPYLRNVDVKWDSINIDDLPLMDFQGDDHQRYALREGDLLVCEGGDVGRAAIWMGEIEGCYYQKALHRLRPRSADSDESRFQLYLLYMAAKGGVFAGGEGKATINHLTAETLRRYRFSYPPRFEQSQIVTFLDRETAKLDALIAKQERLIALVQEKRQALISHAVTKGLNPDVPMKDSGVEWLGRVPAHWGMRSIKHLVRSIEQGWSPQCENYPVADPFEWGVLKVGCVNSGRFDAGENKKLPEGLQAPPDLSIAAGDLLISRANARELVGSAAVAEQDFPRLLLCDKLYRIRLEDGRCLPTFLASYLGIRIVRGQIELEATGASSSMLNIGQSVILDLPVAVPPIQEQRTINLFVNGETTKLDTLIERSRRSIDLLREHRTALISAAVTGKIDVREAA